MASDSRLSLDITKKTEKEDKQTTHIIGIGQADSVYKTFLTTSNVGISTVGQADIDGIPISGYIESFISEKLSDSSDVDDVADKILAYFRELNTDQKTSFLVAGYKSQNGVATQRIWDINISKDARRLINKEPVPNACWNGEKDILTKLILPSFLKEQDHYEPLPHHPVFWKYFTLQDAIDFAKYAIRTTIDTMRFQARAKTVGGPIDILVIKPNEAFWIQRKDLTA